MALLVKSKGLRRPTDNKRVLEARLR